MNLQNCKPDTKCTMNNYSNKMSNTTTCKPCKSLAIHPVGSLSHNFPSKHKKLEKIKKIIKNKKLK